MWIPGGAGALSYPLYVWTPTFAWTVSPLRLNLFCQYRGCWYSLSSWSGFRHAWQNLSLLGMMTAMYYLSFAQRFPRKLFCFHSSVLLVTFIFGTLILFTGTAVIMCFYCRCCLVYQRRKRSHRGTSTFRKKYSVLLFLFVCFFLCRFQPPSAYLFVGM